MRFDRTDDSSLAGIVVFLTIGLGLTLLFFGVDWFWIIFVLGFAVVLPMIGMLTGEAEADDETVGAESANDPLETLRERYARGEIDDAEFERRLDRLLDTESTETDQTAMASDDTVEFEPERETDPATERS